MLLEVLEEIKRATAKAPSEVRTFVPTPDFAKDTVEASCKYMNYMGRQIKEMEGYRKNQDLRSGSQCLVQHILYDNDFVSGWFTLACGFGSKLLCSSTIFRRKSGLLMTPPTERGGVNTAMIEAKNGERIICTHTRYPMISGRIVFRCP